MARNYVAARFQTGAGLVLDTAALEKYDDIIDLSIGDVDRVTDERIIDAAFADAKGGYTRYGLPRGDRQLVEAICAAWSEDHGQVITPEMVHVTGSGCLGLAQAILAICDPGDEILLLSPYFTPYRQQIALAGGIPVEVPALAEDGYMPRLEALEAAVSNRTKALILNNPANPTGKVYSEAELMLLADFAARHDLLIIADEVYTCYVYDGSFIPMRTIPGAAERTITVVSFSKNFFMTGWRIGFTIAEPAIIDASMAAAGMLIYTAPSVSQRAVIKALQLRREIMEENAALFRTRVLYAADRVARLPYLTLYPPKGAFYLFPGAADKSLSSADICSSLLEQAHILVSPGAVFGATGRGHIRIACTVEVPVLKEAFDRMEEIRKL